jgi:hypothetical protein
MYCDDPNITQLNGDADQDTYGTHDLDSTMPSDTAGIRDQNTSGVPVVASDWYPLVTLLPTHFLFQW